ncbi:prepilin-type N-terminal cleavage/methylation domain-containing protein [Candidatus Gracilibacteria bacterium]|nr:prepilin-type N-terminal cleavage/methylation domain-containing protein [Candidatus Gracilibacteria bacterium]
MKIKNKKRCAFTLVELVIVITILSILAIIGFISYSNYIKTTRDSVRLSNINNIINGLESLLIKTSKYPLPEGTLLTGTINNNNIFYKGVFGNELASFVGFNKTPLDPLLKTNYIYSVSYNKKDFQIGTDFEDDQTISYNFIDKTYASNYKKTYVKGQYKGYLIYNGNDSKRYITNIPSLILSNISTGDLLSENSYFVVNNNLNTIYGQSGDFLKTNDLLKNMFDDSNIELQNIDITDCNNLSNIFTTQTINKFGKKNYNVFLELEEKYKKCINTPIPIEGNTNLYTLTDINKIFQDGDNVITDNWAINSCDINNINIDTELFNGTKDISQAISLSGNTIYKITPGDYTLNGTTSTTAGYITFGGDCIGFIGAGTGTTKFISNFTGGGVQTNAGIFGIRGESGTKTNIIVSGITIENSSGATNRYNRGIYGDDKISNITLKDIVVYNSERDGIRLDDDANDNLLSNIKSYNNLGYGVGITYNSKNNLLKNITTYGNSLGGIIVDYSSNNNNLENILSYNNTNHGLYIETNSTGNTISGANLYLNSKNGLYVNTNSSNNTFKNINSYSNALDGMFFDGNSSNNIITNSNIYNNTIRGIYNYGSNGNYFNNINVYNNKGTSSTVYGVVNIERSLNVSINNTNIFNNNIHGMYLNNLDNSIINNLHIFSNKKSTANTGNGFYVESSSTGNIFNDIYIYNNAGSMENYGINNKYYGVLKSSSSGSLIPGTDGYLGFSNGDFNSSAITMDCSWHLNPSGSNYYGSTCVNKSFTGVLVAPVTTLNFGSNISKQKQPVKWNLNTSQFELYGTDGVDYNSSKFIGEF